MWQRLGKTPAEQLAWAISLGDAAAALRLIGGQAPVDGIITRSSRVGSYSVTPLIEAVKQGLQAVVTALLGAGADPNQHPAQEYTALEWAALRAQPAIFHALLAHGADPEPRRTDIASHFSVPLFHHAAAGGDLEILRYLLAQGADPFTLDITGRQPLDYAIAAQRAGAVAVLRALPGERRHVAGPHEAAATGDTARLSGLLDEGTDPNALEPVRRRTPLHLAVLRGHGGAVRLLLEKGADANAVDAAGHTPLTLSGNVAADFITKRLIRHGANPNAPGPDGLTVLLYAIRERFGLKQIRIMVEAGGELNATAPDGTDALSLAPTDTTAVRRYIRERTGAGGTETDSLRDLIRQFSTLANRPACAALAASLATRFNRPATSWRTAKGAFYFHEVPVPRLFPPLPGVIQPAHLDDAAVQEAFNALQDEAHDAGCLLLQTMLRPEAGCLSLVLLPTTTWEAALLARGTNGVNHGVSTRDIITWMQETATGNPFRLTNVGVDFLGARLLATPTDCLALSTRMLAICPDLRDGRQDTATRLAKELEELRTFALWWD